MNKFIHNKIYENIKVLPEHLKSKLLVEAELASALGVSNDAEYKDFFYITLHAEPIADELSATKLDDKDYMSLFSVIYSNRDVYKINTIFGLYTAVKHGLQKLNLPIKKNAYPQGDMVNISPPYDRTKWIAAMKEVYAKMYSGMTKLQSMDLVTQYWDKNERRDFRNWLAFYEQKGHMVYKLANGQYMAVGNGTFVPLDVNSLKATLPSAPQIPSIDEYVDERQQQEIAKQRAAQQKLLEKQELEKNVKALIGRLNSAERIATSKGIDKILGREGFKQWLQALHALKREIQVAPVSLATAQDLVIKRANILISKGSVDGASLLVKIAQVNPADPNMTDPMAGLSEQAQPQDVMAPAQDLNVDSETDAAMEEFVDNMRGITASDDLYVTEDDLVVLAQVPGLPPVTKPPVKAPGEIPAAPEEKVKSEKSQEIENALKDVKLEDVIDRLDSVAFMFRNRELARQLLLIDLMMSELGIASYFPSLAEAIKSALDSNQYVLTRIEDILSRLRGSVEAPPVGIDLSSKTEVPGMEGVKTKLEDDERKERERKEKNKKIEETAPPPAPEAATPVAPVAKELETPAKIETAPPPAPGLTPPPIPKV